MSTPKQTWSVNPRAAAALAVLVVVGSLGAWALRREQERRVLGAVLTLARNYREAGDPDLAIRHLNQCLTGFDGKTAERVSPARRSGLIALLDLKARILAETARSPDQMLAAAKVHEQFLRLEPVGERSQAARRRLVTLYLKYSDSFRLSLVFQAAPELAVNDLRYHAAETLARQLIRLGAGDAEAHRLLAMSVEGLAVPGNRKALDETVRCYAAVLRAEPGDLVSAERLAGLYQERRDDPVRAERVLDDLLKARPRDAEVRLIRHRFFVQSRRDADGAKELEAAIDLAPGDVSVLLAVAEDALRRNDAAGARRQLDKVPAKSRGDLRALLLRGLADFSDERTDEAIQGWRTGNMLASGTDAELTWWLAYALLQTGRIEEAGPLVAQYQRLEGGESPLSRLLAALQDERTGRPTHALAGLEWARDRLSTRWQGMLHSAVGRCQEALGNEPRALVAYRRASQFDPDAVVPRLAVARLLLTRSPDDAVAEIERGLARSPDEPGLLVALARARLRQQAARPDDRRAWVDFERALARAVKAAPRSPALLLMKADRLSLDADPDQVIGYLERTARENPRGAAVATALADRLARQGRRAEALQILERAAAPEACGDSASIRIARAGLLIELGRGREACADLVRGADRLPVADRALVWATSGRHLSARGDVAGARKAYHEWARLLPDDPRPRLVLLELALEGNDEAEAGAMLQALQKFDGPHDVAWRLGQAAALLCKSRAQDGPQNRRDPALEEAAELIDLVLIDAPELPAAHLLRGQVLERRGRTDEAIAAYLRARDHGGEAALPRLVGLLIRRKRYDDLLRLAPAETHSAREAGQSAETQSWRVRLLNHIGRSDDAEMILRALAEGRPDEPEPWLALLRFQVDRRRSQAAAATVAHVLAHVKVARPELLKAQCCGIVGDRDGAETAFSAALAKHPDDLEVCLASARHDEDTDRPARAEARLKSFLDRHPGNRPAARQLAVLLSAQVDDATAWERAWATLGPESKPGAAPEPEDVLARAVVLSRGPDPARRGRAVDLLESLAADLPVTHPTAVAARDHLARLLLEAGRPARASEVAAVAAASESDPEAIALYAQTLIQSRRPDAAGWQIDRLAAIHPGDPRESALRARMIWDPARAAESAAALERAYLVREDLPGGLALGREAFLLLAEKGPEATRIADRLGRRLAGRDPSFSWMPALILARRGHRAEALVFCRAAAESGSLEELREAGRVALDVATASRGDREALDGAGAVLDTARRREPGADDLLIMEAMLRHLQGHYDEEVRLYRAVLERRPENTLVLNNLAWALSEGLHRPDEASPYLDRLTRTAGRVPPVLDTRGVVLTRLGRVVEAIRDLEEATRSEPDGLYFFHLARAYCKAGRDADGRSAFTRARQAHVKPDRLDPTERAEFDAGSGE